MTRMNPETPNAGDLLFSDAARRLLADAQSEADRLHHEYVGTEHLLLALTRQSDDASTLAHLGVDCEQIRASLAATVSPGRAAPAPAIIVQSDLSTSVRPYTSRTNQVLSLAAGRARELGAASIGVEHLLVGMLRERKGIAAQVLEHFGVTLEKVLAQLPQAGADGSPSDLTE